MRLHLALTLALLSAQAGALWPFKQKRFTAEALVNAGDLGLKLDGGRVAAIGDADGDQKCVYRQEAPLTPAPTSSSSPRTRRRSDCGFGTGVGSVLAAQLTTDNFRYKPGAELSFKEHVRNVVPMDFDADGRLDLLVMMGAVAEGGWWGGGGKPRTDMEIVLSGAGGFGRSTERTVDPNANAP